MILSPFLFFVFEPVSKARAVAVVSADEAVTAVSARLALRLIIAASGGFVGFRKLYPFMNLLRGVSFQIHQGSSVPSVAPFCVPDSFTESVVIKQICQVLHDVAAGFGYTGARAFVGAELAPQVCVFIFVSVHFSM